MTTLINSELNSDITFETTIEDLAAGTIITNQFEGIQFSSSSEFGVMLFDTNNVTGDDFDLSATNLGNVLIISEDGNSLNPDDNAAGGIISLEFDRLVDVNNIGLLDIDEPGSSIALYDEDSNLVETIEVESLGDNSFQEITLDFDNIARLDINLAGSGAVTGLDYTQSSANPYSNIYVFGDSLSDTGNLFNATTFASQGSPLGVDIPVIPPSPPYFEGRFSNGSIWVEKLAQESGVTLTPATELSVISPVSEIPSPVTIIDENPVVSPFFNGNTIDRSVNFAFGLAQTGANGSGELGAFVAGLERQVEFFIADHLQAEKSADSSALYILWGGSNDYLAPNADPEETIDNIETEVESLYAIGARNFLVVNLPDIGRLPEANNPNLTASPEELSELADIHNSLLDETVDELSDTLTGANFQVLDVNSLFNDVLANPEEFGLTNVSEPFLNPVTFAPTLGANPDDYFFYDTLHPTEVGHDILNDFALTSLGIESDVI